MANFEIRIVVKSDVLPEVFPAALFMVCLFM